MSFKFPKKTRVTIPGSLATQGVVVDATETLIGFPVYVLRWLTEAGETMTGSCGEGDLASAQPVMGTAMLKPKRKTAKKKSASKRKR